MGLFGKANDKKDLEKQLSPNEMKAVAYAVYFTSNKVHDAEGMELAQLLVSGKRRKVFPIEYDYVKAAVDNMIEIMQTIMAKSGLTPDMPQELLDDLVSAKNKL